MTTATVPKVTRTAVRRLSRPSTKAADSQAAAAAVLCPEGNPSPRACTNARVSGRGRATTSLMTVLVRVAPARMRASRNSGRHDRAARRASRPTRSTSGTTTNPEPRLVMTRMTEVSQASLCPTRKRDIGSSKRTISSLASTSSVTPAKAAPSSARTTSWAVMARPRAVAGLNRAARNASCRAYRCRSLSTVGRAARRRSGPRTRSGWRVTHRAASTTASNSTTPMASTRPARPARRSTRRYGCPARNPR